MLLILLASSILFYSASGQCHRSEEKYIGDLCYTISDQKLNFQDARSFCHGASSNLAVIHTTLQANFLASIVRTQTGAPEGLFWIGLSRPAVGSRFQWDDGTAMYWSNFDSSFSQDNLNVAESTVNGKWRSLEGQELLYFVCSYDPTHGTPGTTQQSTAETATESTVTIQTTYTTNATTGYSTSSEYPSTITQSTAETTTYPSDSSTPFTTSTTSDYPSTTTTDYSTITLSSIGTTDSSQSETTALTAITVTSP